MPFNPSRKGLPRPFWSAASSSGKIRWPWSWVTIFFTDRVFGAQLQAARKRTRGATIFAYQVRNPQQYGVVAIDARGQADSPGRETPQTSLALRGHRPVFL